MKYSDFCLSSFLTFRYVVKKRMSWKKGVKPKYPEIVKEKQAAIKTTKDISLVFENLFVPSNTGILLSGGIDSAILAYYLPKGSKAYTIRFIAEGAIDESVVAQKYADQIGLDLKIVNVNWEDYLKYSDFLMKKKQSPLHAIEVALYKASKLASKEGIENLIVGNGADSTFGGLDKLLSKDWSFNEFIERYTFINPEWVLKSPVSMKEVYSKYKVQEGIDVQWFLKELHGIGIIQTFDSSIEAGGCEVLAPYEQMYLDAELDIERIRKGESKYFLRELFYQLYPEIELPEKIPFARPMDQWLQNWNGPLRGEFLEGLDMNQFTGDQKWLIYILEKFLNLFDAE